MACGCKRTRKSYQLNPQTEQLVLVMCVNCQSPLQRKNGLSVPIHLVPINVEKDDVTKWQQEGYEIKYV